MNSELNHVVARQRIAELRRTAERTRLTSRAIAEQSADASARPSIATERTVTLRFAAAADQSRLARLAALDSATPPAPPVLVAEVDGEALAALGLSDGTIVANPFHPTADLIGLLRARADQLGQKRPMRRSGRILIWRRSQAPAYR
jgi:hypothetical protein